MNKNQHCFEQTISRHLIQQNLISSLPSIYTKYGREMDVNRGIVYLSTCDYFFVEFVSYPLVIGPLIPQILNDIYSAHKQSMQMAEQQSMWWPMKQSQRQSLPPNPFKASINGWYCRVFGDYLDLFLPRTPYPKGHHNAPYYLYGLKWIEIVGELWFGQRFAERPIGDRCHTLPLMQDLLYRIMEKQCDFQRQYAESMPSVLPTDSHRLFGLGKIPKTSCLCPELRVLRPLLFLFLRECFEHFPLDLIAHLRVIVEMWVNVVAPWTIPYKEQRPDHGLKAQRDAQRLQGLHGVTEKTKKQGLLQRLLSKMGSNKEQNQQMLDEDAFARYDDMIGGMNDDRQRTMTANNTQFENAEDLISYELEGVESVDVRVWRQYMIEMLPFYTALTNLFVDSMLKYDLGHPLKQLCVLKVVHLLNMKEVVETLQSAERVIFEPQSSRSTDTYNDSEQHYVVNLIQQITMKPLGDYRCLPFPAISNQNDPRFQSQQLTLQKAHHFYIKCRKVMVRLCPADSGHDEEEEDDDDDDDDNEDQREQHQPPPTEQAAASEDVMSAAMKMIVTVFQIVSGLILSLSSKATAAKRRNQNKGGASSPWQSGPSMTYFAERMDNVLMLRYVIGELQEVFGIGAEQQEELMNVSIMYEPSQSVSPKQKKPMLALHAPSSPQRERARSPTMMTSASSTIWSRPKGEWESDYALRLHRMIYWLIISNTNESMLAFYSNYMSSFHRTYCTDLRVMVWCTLLMTTWFWWWCNGWIFYAVFLLFCGVIVLSRSF